MEWEWGFQVFNKYLNVYIVWLFCNVIYMPSVITNIHYIYIAENPVFQTNFHYNTEIINRHTDTCFRKFSLPCCIVIPIHRSQCTFEESKDALWFRSNVEVLWTDWTVNLLASVPICQEGGKWGDYLQYWEKHQQDYGSPSCRRVEKEERLAKRWRWF